MHTAESLGYALRNQRIIESADINADFLKTDEVWYAELGAGAELQNRGGGCSGGTG